MCIDFAILPLNLMINGVRDMLNTAAVNKILPVSFGNKLYEKAKLNSTKPNSPTCDKDKATRNDTPPSLRNKRAATYRMALLTKMIAKVISTITQKCWVNISIEIDMPIVTKNNPNKIS